LRTGENQRYIARRTMAGVTRTIDVLFVLVPERHEGDAFIIASARDITDMQHVEDQLHQAQKMEAVGQLTGGIAHDFNNLLTTILGNLELLGARLGGGDEPSVRLLAAVRTAAERGARLTTQLLAFARQQRMTPKPIELNRIINGMGGLLQSAVGATNRIETALADRLALAFADPSQIELVILNLAINSRDAMPDGGTITIKTSNVRLGAPERPEEPIPGDYVMWSEPQLTRISLVGVCQSCPTSAKRPSRSSGGPRVSASDIEVANTMVQLLLDRPALAFRDRPRAEGWIAHVSWVPGRFSRESL